MTFRNRLQYLLVKKLQIANKEAIRLILSGQILVNGIVVDENVVVSITDEVVYQNQIIKAGKKLLYIAFYKPRGIETTLNTSIPDNLKSILPFEEKLFPVGRLDKESEGLLLLTNDGTLFDKTLRKEYQTEKEYIVEVNKPLTETFLATMSSGVFIMGQTTLPCKITPLDAYTFQIVLVQGLNRQIRRMCYKLGYEVVLLKRTRINTVLLGNLQPNEFEILTKI